MELVVGDSFMVRQYKITLRKGGSTMKKLFTVIAASMLLMAGNLYARQQKSDVSFGTNATGIELIGGVLSPITNGAVSLGSSSLQFDGLYISGTATLGTVAITGDTTHTGVVINTSQRVVVSSYTRNIDITSSYVTLVPTGTTINTGGADAGTAKNPLFSTTTATAGQYAIITSTVASCEVVISSGTTPCLISAGAIDLTQYDSIGIRFNGSYWVVESSRVY